MNKLNLCEVAKLKEMIGEKEKEDKQDIVIIRIPYKYEEVDE